jgi:hypothetical protein
MRIVTSEAEPAADLAHRRRTRQALEAGARDLGCVLTGPIRSGWGDRTAGAPATRSGEPCWVRVVGENPYWIRDDPTFWNGNLDANAISGVPKPTVLAWTELRAEDRWFRIEVQTLITTDPISATPEVTIDPDLSSTWFAQLAAALDALADTPTERVVRGQAEVTLQLRQFFGDRIDPAVESWTTAHADLHWANLTAPDLTILDWEGWGRAPAGYDAATLYCHSLLVPDVAEAVRARFAEILDSPDGRRSQLLAASRMLRRTETGDYLDLVVPLHDLTDRILGR